MTRNKYRTLGNLIALSTCLFINTSVFAQKQPIDFKAIDNWPLIAATKITNNGLFVGFCVLTDNRRNSELNFRSVNGEWSKKVRTDNQDYYFTSDSRIVVYRNLGDTLTIQTLGIEQKTTISHPRDFKVLYDGTSDWLAYHAGEKLILENLSHEQRITFSNVARFVLFNGKALLIFADAERQKQASYEISFADLNSGSRIQLGRINSPSAFAIEPHSGQIVFFSSQAAGNISPVIRYFKPGMDSSVVLVNQTTSGLEGMTIRDDGYGFNFDRNGNTLSFHIVKVNPFAAKNVTDSTVTARIWNYRDKYFMQGVGTDESYDAIFNFNSQRVVRLQLGDDQVIGNDLNNLNDDYVLLLKDNTEIKYQRAQKKLPFSTPAGLNFQYADLYLVSKSDGSRVLIKEGLFKNGFVHFFFKDFVVWFDALKGQWFSFDIKTMVTKNITGNIPFSLANVAANNGLNEPADSFGMPAFIKATGELLIYDEYDIWKIDPSGRKQPVNITSGYGRAHKTVLRLCKNFMFGPNPGISQNDTLILSSFSPLTKESGFFSFSIAKQTTPKPLIKGNDRFSPFATYDSRSFPIKALNADVYLLSRFNVDKYPNLFVTKHFKDFVPLTNLAPQHDYRWYQTELIHYRLLDGTTAEGTLYKPEDFDAHKKYPVLFFYYEASNNAVNNFETPKLSDAEINIPWYTSRGYLVFRPNIHYKLDHPGQSACDHVVSAASYLSKSPWVNSKKMGLQGHSFGGYETEYIVSHSRLFTCAVSGAGISDLFSGVAANTKNITDQNYFISEQGRISQAVIQNPALYISNSPLFSVQNITTPLLLVHGNKDDTVPFQQSVELFLNLAQLHRPAWLLEYDGEKHSIEKRQNSKDLTIRMTEFFDHYLMDKPMPSWMIDVKTPKIR